VLDFIATRSPAAAAANAHSWGKGAPSEKSCDPKSLLGRSHDVIQGRKIESTSYIAVTPASCFVGSSSKSCVGLHRCKWSRTGLGWRGTLGRGDESHQESVVISTLKTSKFGTILVSGKTLYTLKPSSAACTASCQKFWPELLLPKGVTSATAGKGLVQRNSEQSFDLVALSRSPTLANCSTGTSRHRPGQVKGNVTDTWGKWSDVATISPLAAFTPRRRRALAVAASASSYPSKREEHHVH